MAAYFNLNKNEISKEHLVNKFNIILDNQGRLMQNDQKIPLSNEPQRSLGFVQKQSPDVFCKKKVFSCEICEIFKNMYFQEHLRNTASICFTSKYYSK